MPTSRYFNNFAPNKNSEQRLYEDLVAESIRIHGHDIWYIPREDFNESDFLYGENVNSKFSRAYLMEMYIANTEGWQGPGDIFKKFGMNMFDGSNFILSKRTFDKYMPIQITTIPRIGDLLYVPVMNKMFEIKFVEEELLFFTRGMRTPYLYELRTEAFRTSNEIIRTGVEEIDVVDDLSSYIVEISLTTGSGNYEIGETVYQGANLNYSSASARVSDWQPSSNTLFLMEIKGQFEPSANIIGVTTGTIYRANVADTLKDNTFYDLFNNKDIQVEANTIIDLSERNPFGLP